MNTYIISDPIELLKIKIDLENLECRLKQELLNRFSGKVVSDYITGGVSEELTLSAKVHPGFTAKIIDNPVFIERSTPESMSVIFRFTEGDIIEGKLIRTHNFNQPLVDISVSDNFGKEIMLGVDFISDNVVSIDFSRVTVIGQWSLLIEK